MSLEATKKKRGRKPKVLDKDQVAPATAPKKRGRKPKGGKVLSVEHTPVNQVEPKQNIILHLKCSMDDLTRQTHYGNHEPTIEPYSLNSMGLQFHVIDKTQDNTENYKPSEGVSQYIPEQGDCHLTNKLKELAINLHQNELPDTRSDCFWCTCSYDNPPIHIPKKKFDNNYQVYGSFCCPECAAGYLFKENLDSSTKFERYHLLNYLYGVVYKYSKNIIPAPAPYYLLNKYYGTLTIQEYRKLLRKDQIILVIDKPLTRTTPEIFNENNEFSIQCLKKKGKISENYRLCRKNTNSKITSLTEKFYI
jgi:hypothetical protein